MLRGTFCIIAALAATFTLSNCASTGDSSDGRAPDRRAAKKTLEIISRCFWPQKDEAKTELGEVAPLCEEHHSSPIILSDGSTLAGPLFVNRVETELEAAGVEPPNWLLFTLMGHKDTAYRYAAFKMLESDPETAEDLESIDYAVFERPKDEGFPIELALLADKWATVE